MQAFVSFFRLIRWINLCYIALTQYLVQYTIIKPILARAGAGTTLDDLHFFLLVISTVLIAAAGYIINDYFDVKVDEINKPQRILIDRGIHRRTAVLLHQFLTGAGILLALYVAWRAGNFKLGFIHAIVAAFLWFYSTGYKKKLLVGNVVVSFLSGLVILIVALYERHLFEPSGQAVRAAYTIFIIVFFYFLFAFLTSLARELVKDIEDIEGDRRFHCRTIPVVWGIERTRQIIMLILLSVLLLLVYIQQISFRGGDYISVLTIFTTLEFPLFIAMYLLWKARDPNHFTAVSSVIKIVMLMGILSMLYFYFLSN